MQAATPTNPAELLRRSGLTSRVDAARTASEHAARLLAHAQHTAFSTGKQQAGDWYGSLLTARGHLWTITAALAETRALLGRMHTHEGSIST